MSNTSVHPMEQFHVYLQRILEKGVRRPNRTGEDTIFYPGSMMKFDLTDGFPAISTKKLAFKSMVGELLGFFRGYTSAAQFREIGCGVWDANANVTPAWLANPARSGPDDLGRIYSAQWTDLSDWREAFCEADEARLMAGGYELKVKDPTALPGTSKPISVWRRGINQLEACLHMILTNPYDRRIIIDGWRPDEHDRACVPACHVAYQFLCDPQAGQLHMTLWQRSFDSALAFNVSLGALFLEIMARLSGYHAASFTHFISDGHVYWSHIDGVRTMLERHHHPLPKLVISDRVRRVTPDEVRGAFQSLQPDDFALEGYTHHPAVKFTMAA